MKKRVAFLMLVRCLLPLGVASALFGRVYSIHNGEVRHVHVCAGNGRGVQSRRHCSECTLATDR